MDVYSASYYSSYDASAGSLTISRDAKLTICLEKGGLQNAPVIVRAASLQRFDLAQLAAIIEEESGGRNIYGADPTPNGALPPSLYDQPITRENFETFWRRVQEGYTSNGVGLPQLTYPGFIQNANQRGGAWVPIHQCTEACAVLTGLLKAHSGNWQAAAATYNGAGPAADAYGMRVQALTAQWQARINATIG